MLANRRGRAFRIVRVHETSDGRLYELSAGQLIPQSCLDAGLWVKI